MALQPALGNSDHLLNKTCLFSNRQAAVVEHTRESAANDELWF